MYDISVTLETSQVVIFSCLHHNIRLILVTLETFQLLSLKHWLHFETFSP